MPVASRTSSTCSTASLCTALIAIKPTFNDEFLESHNIVAPIRAAVLRETITRAIDRAARDCWPAEHMTAHRA